MSEFWRVPTKGKLALHTVLSPSQILTMMSEARVGTAVQQLIKHL